MVEPLGQWQEFGLIPKVPFAKATGGVAFGLEHFGNRDFIRVQTAGFAGKDHRAIHADPVRIGPCHQRGP